MRKQSAFLTKSDTNWPVQLQLEISYLGRRGLYYLCCENKDDQLSAQIKELKDQRMGGKLNILSNFHHF